MSVSAHKGAAPTVGRAQILAFRQRCQRLDQRTPEALGELVAAIACVPTPGGATPYLALRARSPRHDRRLVDRATFEADELVEVPFARATSALATVHDAPLLLAAARRSHEQRIAPLRTLSLDRRKLPRLFDAVVAALHDGPLAADDLRARLPEPLCVPLGEAGRKAGFPSLFSLALRELQLDGAVLRRQRETRLDREIFVYALPRRPLVELDRATALAALAHRYFRAYAPSPASAFAYWADASLAEARVAITQAELAEVVVDECREPCFLGPEQLEEFLSFDPPVPARLAFVPFRDPSVSGGRDLRGMLAAKNQERPLADWRGRLVPAGGGSAAHQNFVLLGGYIVGVWEFDEDARRVRYATFDPLPTRMRRAADEAAHELGDYVAQELGTARFYGDERGERYGRLDEVVAAWGGETTVK